MNNESPNKFKYFVSINVYLYRKTSKLWELRKTMDYRTFFN